MSGKLSEFVNLLDAYLDEREEDSIGPRQLAARKALITHVEELLKTERERCARECERLTEGSVMSMSLDYWAGLTAAARNIREFE